MPSNSIEISNLNFQYDNRPILQGINLTIPHGSVVAIMGGSGCGKTTLLRCIGGQLRPSIGEIKFEDKVINRLNSKDLYAMRRRIGMLFQFGALFTDISVFENVAFPLREHTNLTEAMIHDLVLLKLHAVGLRGVANLMPQELSGGMARRVALARAIALDPMLMMYDEPFTGLDPISLAITGQLIKKLNQALGATSIMVTHDVSESFAIVDLVFFMANGKIIASGTPEEMRNSDHPYVRQFVDGLPDGPVPFHVPAVPLAEVFL